MSKTGPKPKQIEMRMKGINIGKTISWGAGVSLQDVSLGELHGLTDDTVLSVKLRLDPDAEGESDEQQTLIASEDLELQLEMVGTVDGCRFRAGEGHFIFRFPIDGFNLPIASKFRFRKVKAEVKPAPQPGQKS